MLNPYSPSRHTLRCTSHSYQESRDRPVALIASLTVGMVFGLCLTETFFEWFHEGAVRYDAVARKVTRNLTTPSFAITFILPGFLLPMGWRRIRSIRRSPYISTVQSRFATGCTFICVFFASGNLVSYPLRKLIGGGSAELIVELIVVPLALIAAALTAVEMEAAVCQPKSGIGEPLSL